MDLGPRPKQILALDEVPSILKRYGRQHGMMLLRTNIIKDSAGRVYGIDNKGKPYLKPATPAPQTGPRPQAARNPYTSGTSNHGNVGPYNPAGETGVGLLSAEDVAFVRSKLGDSETNRLLFGTPPPAGRSQQYAGLQERVNQANQGRPIAQNQGSMHRAGSGNIGNPGRVNPGDLPVALPVGGGSNMPNAYAQKINPVDYELVAWTRWGPCNTTCGVGFQARTRNNHPGSAEWRRCVEMECEDDYANTYGRYPAEDEEEEGSSPWPMLFGMLLMVFIILSGVGVYFLVKNQCQNPENSKTSSSDRGPLPPTPDEKGRRASKGSKKKPKKKKHSDTDDEDGKLRLLSSDDEENPYLEPSKINPPEENPYLDISEINPPGSDYEISQLRDAPAPPSKHYLDDEEVEDAEPDYIEFEG
ncbi:uncharacterized protein [Amphiura filiformis]|uniref:uncharacterized protein n=1 Tax=Amphiura filiformis TaxID=82378 RepID=UPI003B220C77